MFPVLTIFSLLIAQSLGDNIALQHQNCPPAVTVTETVHLPTATAAASLLKENAFAKELFSVNEDVASDPDASRFPERDVSEWLSSQLPFSLQGILNNIHPRDTAPGVVIASTSRTNPPYFFHWTRDAALTMDVMVNKYAHATSKQEERLYEQLLWDYAQFSRQNQLQNKGCVDRGDGRCENVGGPGEPKYEVNGEVYTGPWGRPQTDGPALRASTLMRFANAYLEKGGDMQRVKKELYGSRMPADTVIKTDLEFTAHKWHERTFDLWEEVNASHFFTRMVQRKALLESVQFCRKMGDEGAAQYYGKVAMDIQRQLERHWNHHKKQIDEMIETPDYYKRGSLNVATVLAVNHGYHDDKFFGPTDARVLRSIHLLLQEFNKIYPINHQKRDNRGHHIGPAVGRYPEDVYDGTQGDAAGHQGHPWFLATLAVAELYYKAINEWKRDGLIVISDLSKPWFESVGVKDVFVNEEITSSSAHFHHIISHVGAAAENIVRRVMFHMGGNQHMAEQFNRHNGRQLSAENLTWSYASVLTMNEARDKVAKN